VTFAVGDLRSALSAACVSILTADTTLRTLLGRTSRMVIPQKDVGTEMPLPCIVYHYERDVEIGGTGDERFAQLVFEAVCDGNDAPEKAGEIVAAIRRALTYTKFHTAGIEAYVLGDREVVSVPREPDETRALALVQLRCNILASAP
jgi:hypothetical protein